jgi:hypothetical protein
MKEVSGYHFGCEFGNFHLQPWVIPFVLDSDTSKPLPRENVQIGRAAFFDLRMDGMWGGIITGDHIELHWDGDCECGRSSPFISPNINRFSDLKGGSDKITCAATPQAYADAMSYLTGIA